MALFMPAEIFRDVTCITPEYLKKRGICALILDVDNTLTDYGSQVLPREVKNWILQMQNAGISMVLSSNNFKKRVEPFAKKAGLPYVSFSLKPSPKGLLRAQKLLLTKKGETALVGDQIFTDCLAANLYGITMLLVRPEAKDVSGTVRLRRKLEEPFIKHYIKKGGKINE